MFNRTNNTVLDVSGNIVISGDVEVFDGELLVNTIDYKSQNTADISGMVEFSLEPGFYESPQTIELFCEDKKQKNIFSAIRIPELSSLIDESVKQKKPIERELSLIYPKEKIFKIWVSGRRDLGKNKLNFIRLFDTTSQHNIQNIQRDFIANASHELKTPIASIIGYCETLIDESPKKNSKKDYRDLRRFIWNALAI